MAYRPKSPLAILVFTLFLYSSSLDGRGALACNSPVHAPEVLPDGTEGMKGMPDDRVLDAMPASVRKGAKGGTIGSMFFRPTPVYFHQLAAHNLAPQSVFQSIFQSGETVAVM